ncbi:MAG: hypothetical protein RMK29_08765 [Myxococcales bacterium]|nr:hypothetical protein [Myxococcales bacterium]
MAALCALACDLPIKDPPPAEVELEDPPLDPRTLFETQARPELALSCQGCHSREQDTVKPFLVEGREYESIVAYEMGRFLTPRPEQSILLTKGVHMGPALTEGQYQKVLAWLQVEVATRGVSAASSPSTPSVAVRAGDFYISLEGLVGDPLSKITFKLEPRQAGIYRLSELRISAGPVTGIKIKNPILILYSINGARRDPADSLSGVELTLQPQQSATLGTGTVLLTNVPQNARLGLAFQIISQVNPKPLEMFQCKDFALFDARVRPTLQAPCSTLCHGMGAADPRAAQAFGAFDMTQARSTDPAVLRQFCLRTLGRVNLADPARSVLILQATPAEAGGTTNHPYKLPQHMTFAQNVVQWAAAEK